MSRLLAAERRVRRTRRNSRALGAWKQALYVLAWFRKREDIAALGAGSGSAGRPPMGPWMLLKLINQARRRINRPVKGRPQTDAARSKVDQEVKEVSALLKAVQTQLGDVAKKTAPHRSFDANDVTRLDIELPGSDGDHRVRAQKYRDAKDVLDATETRANSILGDIARREKDLQAQLRQEIANERARFNETPPPPS